MKPKDQSYKKLEQLWYDKLKKEGFQDIENTKTDERLLKEWDFNFFRNQFNLIQYESTLGYYDQAKEILVSESFKSEIHKKVWELHCEGLSERSIAVRVKEYKKSMIHYIIANIASKIKG